MIDNKKVIEEMTEAIPYDIIRYDQKPKGQHLYWEQRKEIAVALVNANYGNIKQALTEFAQKVSLKAYDLRKTTIGDDNGDIVGVDEYVDKILNKTLKELGYGGDIPE